MKEGLRILSFLRRKKFVFSILLISLTSLVSLIVLFNSSDKNTKAPHKYSPAERAYYFSELEFMKTRDPNTDAIPQDIKIRELEFARTIPSREDYKNFNRKTNAGVLTVGDWKSRGPLNVSGRMKAIGYDVTFPSVINAAAASGGMWRSIDGGVSWAKTSAPNSMQTVYCLTQDSRSGQTNNWYCGTGELLSTTDRKSSRKTRTVGLGGGIYKSSDNGASWHLIMSTKPGTTGTLNEAFQGVWNIVVDRKSSQPLILAACYGGIYRTSDGGYTWSHVLGDKVNKSFGSDIVQTDKGDFYAALTNYSLTGSKASVHGVFHSEDGIRWDEITPANYPADTRVVKIALAPSNNNVFYLLTENPLPSNDPIFSFTFSTHTFWKYVNIESEGVGTWEDRSKNIEFKNLAKVQEFNTLGGYACVLAVKPDNENTVFLGGTNLYRSTNAFQNLGSIVQIGGYNTYQVYDPYGNGLHPDIHALTFNPQNPNILLVGSDGGIHKTDNCTNANVRWNGLKNGLQTTQFYSIGLDPATPNDEFLMGGLQDNFTQFTYTNDYKQPWNSVFGGDGMSVAIAKNVEFAIGCVYNGYIVSALFYDKVLYDVQEQRPSFLTDDMFEFYTSFALDPNNNKTFYLPAKNKLWRKKDMRASALDTGMKDEGWNEMSKVRLPDGESIVSLGLSTAPANRLYFGSSKGRVFRVDDAHTGNPAAVEITGAEFPADAYAVCIEVDPKNADNMFVVFSNYNVKSIFYTSDGGQSWTNVSGNLEENTDGSGAGPSVRWLKILHYQEKIIYLAATSVGVFSTMKLDGDKTVWIQEGAAEIGNVIVDHIDARESDGYIVVATQGYGVFGSNVSISDVESGNQNNPEFALNQNYPNPAASFTDFSFSVPKGQWVEIKLFDETGREIASVVNSYYPQGKHKARFGTSALKQGIYFYRILCEEGVLTKKMIVSR